MKKIFYLTYQVFPNDKANNIQTIKTIEALNKLGYKTSLFFPDRGKGNKEDSNIFQYYGVQKKFKITKLKHYLPFNRTKYFKKITFVFSSFIWSYYASKKVVSESNEDTIFYTRTHWLLFFLSRKARFIIYECHKYSKIENLIFKLINKNNNILLIFSNENLKDQFKLGKNLNSRSFIIGSAFDESSFLNPPPKKLNNKIIFVGQLLRFNQSRNINFLIKAFSDIRLKDFNLTIVGGPESEVRKLSINSPKNVSFLGHLDHKKAIREIQTSEIGILINPGDKHSKYFTSPLKYFEYLRGGLKIVAVDYTSHKSLPIQDNIFYFEDSNTDSFIKAIISSSQAKFRVSSEIALFSYLNRTKKILAEIARLEGLEPPTL